jgi:hypothetical protein
VPLATGGSGAPAQRSPPRSSDLAAIDEQRRITGTDTTLAAFLAPWLDHAENDLSPRRCASTGASATPAGD